MKQDENRFKSKKYLIFLVIVLELLFFWVYLGRTHKYLDYSQASYDTTVGQIVDKVNIKQSFVVEKNNFSEISLLAATYSRINYGQLEILLKKKKTGEVVVKKNIKMENLIDNQYINIDFPAIQDSGNLEFEISIQSPKSSNGNSVTFWSSSEDVYKNGALIINGKQVQQDIVFTTFYEMRNIDFYKNMIKNVTPKYYTLLYLLLIVLWVTANLFFFSLIFSKPEANKLE